jgi:N-acetylmuramoyl-L-alanine amidase
MRRQIRFLLLFLLYLYGYSGFACSQSGPRSEGGGSREIRNYSIFGKDYSRVEIIDNKLAGHVYYLMSGHGGPDPGASGKYGRYTLTEDEYAYDVTLRLARNLIQHGALVYMITRDKNDGIRDESILSNDSDERCYPDEVIPVNQMARLRQRTVAVNNLYKKYKGRQQRLIVIHLDSRSTGENIDVFFYHHKNSRTGKNLANSIHSTFRSKYRKFQPNRTYTGTVTSRSSLYVIRNTHPPAVFIELGNIRNTKDQRRFVLHDNRQALANWITDGIISD